MNIRELADLIQPTDEERWAVDPRTAGQRMSEARNMYDGPIPRGVLAEIKAHSRWERQQAAAE